MLAVETKELSKSFMVYKSFSDRLKNRGVKIEALKNVNLEIKKGEIFGLLGPNGAGKTTLMNILSTLVLPDSGEAKVFGYDTIRDSLEVRKVISLSSAYSGFSNELTTRENLEIFAMYYNMRANINRFISLVDLKEHENKLFGDLSSGNKQKLVIAKSLMVNPKLMLLDELTVALDPRVTIEIRKLLKNWRNKYKTTILLATHNMFEADELCNRVAIIHMGNIVACDTPKNLKKVVNEEEAIKITLDRDVDPSKSLKKLEGIKRISFTKNRLTIHVDEADKRLQKIIEALFSKNYHVLSIKIREPTLEDVFLKLTGARLE